MTDRESRVLLYQISTMMRPIQFDEEETTTLQDSEARYLLLALTNYHRFHLSNPLPWLPTAAAAATAGATALPLFASQPASLCASVSHARAVPQLPSHCCLLRMAAWLASSIRLHAGQMLCMSYCLSPCK